jgi:hypothetical protein
MRQCIQVLRTQSGRSLVTSHDQLRPIKTFVHKYQAVAIGRALAFSRGLPLWVYGDDGVPVRQSPDSLTYSKHLS